jgi:hypothetical protein
MRNIAKRINSKIAQVCKINENFSSSLLLEDWGDDASVTRFR